MTLTAITTNKQTITTSYNREEKEKRNSKDDKAEECERAEF